MNTFRSEQFLTISLQEAWDFFSAPKNLDLITPEDMAFRLTSEPPERIYEGLLITYKVSPVLRIPLGWVTKITEVKEPYYFVDEQLKGPYKMWRHEHHFEEAPGGVLMRDIVRYSAGKSILGKIAERTFVDKRVRAIFAFRKKKLEELFPVK